MRILAQSSDKPDTDRDRAMKLLREEAAEVWRLKKQGVIRDIWFTNPNRDAVMIMECSSVAEARSVLAELPLVKHGLIAFDVVELVTYDGFERLFRESC
jgi:muconolactone delta-isomerase